MILRKINTLILVISLLLFPVSYGKGENVSFPSENTIVPESRLSPLSNPEIARKMKIKTALWVSLKQSPDLFSKLTDQTIKKNNYRFNHGQEKVECGFSKSKIVWAGEENELNTIIFVPCRIEDKSFGAYLFRDNFGMISIILYSKEEQKEFLSNIKKVDSRIHPKYFKDTIISDESYEKNNIFVVKKGDTALALVSRFLSDIGAKSLNDGLDIITDNNQLLAADGAYIVSPGIIINSQENEQAQANSILMQLFMLVDGSISLSDLNFYKKAFVEYIDDSKEFNNLSSQVKERVSYFDKNLSLSSFNSYSEFLDIVGKQKFKTPQDTSDFLIESVANDIRKIVEKVSQEEMFKNDPPVKKIKIGNISQAVVPPAILDSKGTMVVNENFARCLLLLKEEFELDDLGGNISMESSFYEGKQLEFNIYETLIYSFVINYMNAAVIARKDVTDKWQRDMLSKGEFGNKYGYINFLGYLYYKFVIAEMGEGFWSEDIKSFLLKHPEIWRKFRKETEASSDQAIVDGINADLYKLKQFFETVRYAEAPIYFERFPREEIISYLDVFEYLCENKHRPWTVEDLGKVFGGDLDENDAIKYDAPLRRSVDFLEKIGIINSFEIVDLGKGPKRYKYQYVTDLMQDGKTPEIVAKKYYMVAPLDEKEQVPAIRSLLTSCMRKPKEVYEAKTIVLDLIGENWTRTFLGNLKRVINEAKVFKKENITKKILIGLETGWVPEGQKKPIGELRSILRQLDLEGIVEIVEGDSESIGSVMQDRMIKENLIPQQVIAMVSKDTLEKSNLKKELGFEGNKAEDPFIVGVDPSNLTDDSYIRIMEMLVMALRRSFKILPIAEHPDIEVIINKDGTIIFIPSAEPLGDLAERYYTRQRKVLLSA